MRCLALAALALIALAACAPRAVVRADLGERRWHAVASPFVTLYTDLAVDDAMAMAGDLEIRRRIIGELYARLLVPGRPLPAGRLVVMHFEICSDLEALWGPRRTGQAAVSADFLRQRIALTCEDPSGWTREVITHELAHLISYQVFRYLPAWLEEGLATFFQTLRSAPSTCCSASTRAASTGWRGATSRSAAGRCVRRRRCTSCARWATRRSGACATAT
jgi:hypothetical protein